MTLCRLIVALAATLTMALCPAVYADEPIVVDVTGKKSQPTSDSSRAKSSVSTDNLVGTGASVADVVRSVPGVQVRRFGTLGSFTVLSIRGFANGNVGILLDDIPLASSSLAPVGLSLLPLESIERIDVYRGAGPISAATPIGGVIRLQSKLPSSQFETSGHVGYGAFQSRSAHADFSGPLGNFGLRLSASYQGTQGNFRYYNDRETLYNAHDDIMSTRRNNAANLGHLQLNVTHKGPADGIWVLRSHLNLYDQGVPGPGIRPTEHTHANGYEGAVRLALRDAAPLAQLRLNVGADAMTGRRWFADPDSEVGLRTGSNHAQLSQAGSDIRAVYTWTPNHKSEIASRFTWEQYQQSGAHNAPNSYADAIRKQRLNLGIGTEHTASIGALSVLPALRFDGVNEVHDDAGTQAQLSPRLGGVYQLPYNMQIDGSVGRFHRFATVLERYGDGVNTVPNANLKSELGKTADFGGVWAPRALGTWIKKPRLELKGFATEADRLIVLLFASANTLRAVNLGKNRIVGIESAASVDIGALALSAAYTYTHARDVSGIPGMDGQQTAGLPTHRLFTQTTLTAPHATLRYETMLVSQMFLAAGDQRPIPTRVFHDLFLDMPLWNNAWVAHFTIRNLTNRTHENVRVLGGVTGVAKVADFIGYPLPGRSFFASLTWHYPGS